MMSPMRWQHGLMNAGIWISANHVAYAGINYWEHQELSQRYDVPVATLYAYEHKTIPMKLAGSERAIELWYRLLKPTSLKSS